MTTILRRRTSFVCFGLRLRLFCLGLHHGLLVADVGEREVLLRWLEEDHGLLDVDVGVEGLSLFYSLALERRHQRAQVTEVHDIAIGDDVLSYLSSVVEDCLDLLAVEGGGLGHSFAEVAEVNAVSSRRLCDLHHLTSMFADSKLTLDDHEL